ncbi:MAG: LysM peptidoglycan-binding domain-containing protein [Anaerolineae bacterium]|nr:LysM peptidoglycan-binding domain-containing protein [Anaerolineae bacterium]
MARKIVSILWISLLAFLLIKAPGVSYAQGDSPETLIMQVNALRAGAGLSPLTADSSLMAAAQSHSEFQAANGVITHVGAGNSAPRDRAIAAGYGGGSPVRVSENIAAGTNLLVADAIVMYWSDSVHMGTMLDPDFKHVGAGVAVSGDFVYYTLVVGSTEGQSKLVTAAPTATALPATATPAGAFTATPGGTPEPNQVTRKQGIDVAGVQTATALPDGSLVHEVTPGQSLWGIAMAYGVTIDDILKINNLPANTVIWPGDKLLILPAFTPTVSPTVTETPVPATPSATPTSTLSAPTATSTPDNPPTETPRALVPVLGSPPRQFAAVGIILISLVGLGLIVLGALRRR